MRWFRGCSLALMAWAGLSSCSSAPSVDPNDPVVAWVQSYPIHRSVVTMIAEDQGIDSDQALKTAADTLRLYIAYQENPNAPKLSAEQTHFLRTQSAVRLWLTEDFEPRHTAKTVPRTMLKSALETAVKRGDPFRPRLHGLCQIIVKPKPEGSKKDPRDIPGFESKARETIAALHNALKIAEIDLKQGTHCTLFNTWVNSVVQDSHPDLLVKKEGMLLDLSQARWDEDFVAKVSPVSEPTLLEPFMTQFGLHLVYVGRVFEAHLPPEADGSIAPDVQRKRETQMRDLLVEPWRKKALDTLLETLAKTQVIQWQGASVSATKSPSPAPPS